MSAPQQPEVSAGLTGMLLVATPLLGDGTFHRSVVLLLDHDEEGALGVVVNRPTPVDLGEVLPGWAPYASEPGVIFQGGPVALDSALGLGVARDGRPGSAPGDRAGWRQVVGRLGLIDLDATPEDVAADMTGLRIFAGYAGWSAGQLEEELREGAWYVVPAEPSGFFQDAFSPEPDRLWRAVLRRQGGDLAMVSTYIEDPSLN